jgi:hypothetical protein
MTQEKERGAIRPVHVLDHEQHRVATADAGEQVGHRGIEAMAFGVGIPRDGRRQLTNPAWKLREEARQLASSGSEVGTEHVWLGRAHEVLEGGEEWPVWRAHGSVTRAVEDEHAISRRLSGELPDEAALSGAGLAAEQGDPPGFAPRARQERSQGRELARAPDERQGGREAERAGERRQGCGGWADLIIRSVSPAHTDPKKMDQVWS